MQGIQGGYELLGRNLDDLRRIVSGLNQRSITVQFVKKGLTSVGEDSPMSKLLFNVLGSFGEFERNMIREPQREGKYRGRKPSLTAERAADLRKRAEGGEKKAALAREFAISRETLCTCAAKTPQKWMF